MNDRQTTWQSKLGSALDTDLLRELEDGLASPDDPAIMVYLYSGAVDEVRPVSSVTLTGDSIVLRYDGAAVANYRRQDVSFCSRRRVAPFPS